MHGKQAGRLHDGPLPPGGTRAGLGTAHFGPRTGRSAGAARLAPQQLALGQV